MEIRMRFMKFTIALALAAVLVGLGAPFASCATERLEVVSSFYFDRRGMDLAWDGKYLWATNPEKEEIYKLDTSGNIISSLHFSIPAFPYGVTWDGEYLWATSTSTNKIYKFDTSGNVISSFHVDGKCPCGLAWDGEHLWTNAPYKNRILEYDTSGNLVSSFDFPWTWGLTWDGEHLWAIHRKTKKIYKLDTSGNVISSFDPPSPTSCGLAWDGEYLWVSDAAENRIYRLQVTTDNEAPSYTLNVSLDPAEGGSVTLDPPGGTYSEGTVVTLTAQPAENYKFVGWSGDASGSAPTITVTMDSDKSVIASFQKISPPGPGEEFPAVWVGVGAAVIGAIAAVFVAIRRFG